MSNCLDPDQIRHYVRPDLGPNCLQTTFGDKELKRWPKKEYMCLLSSFGAYLC